MKLSLLIYQRPIGTGLYTGRDFSFRAQIALNHLGFGGINLDCSIRAGHNTGPTTHTFFGQMFNHACFIIFYHGPGDAGLHACRFITVPTIEGKRYMALLVHGITGFRSGAFFLVSFNYIL